MGGRMNEVKCCPCPDCNGNTIYECKHKEEWEIALRRAKIGEAWEMDSSLEKWFPLTAEELAKLKSQAVSDRYVIRRLVEAIDQYLSKAGYSAASTILTNARADAVNLK
jgi:hypothetical protein